MGTIYVARSKALSQWGYDVGLSKHLYKIGYTEESVKDVVAAGWAGETDWELVKKQDNVEGTSEDEIIARLAGKLKMIDPRLNPRIKDTRGIFKIVPTQVENHLLVTRALAGEPEIKDLKIKPADIAAYMIAGGLG
ncbi:MAG: hypothetical protein JWM91_5255 [Rhodospirillales bacterium]|nr:hypothetical protein [Rhodospirillales bacterium]